MAPGDEAAQHRQPLGAALSMPGGGRADGEQAIVKLTGPAGQDLIDALNERIGRGDFGDWAQFDDNDAQRLTIVTGEGRTEWMSSARDVGLQFVLLLTIRLQPGPSKNKPIATLDARVLDVGGASNPPPSAALTNEGSVSDVEKAAAAWAETLVGELEEGYSCSRYRSWTPGKPPPGSKN